MTEILGVLGSKNRLRILIELSKNDMYVSEIMKKIGMDGKTAKYHLKKLENAGIISSIKKGRRKYYKLKREIILQISPAPERRYILQIPKKNSKRE
ncbi:MAG: metalloregulator ArsR/SmtB family transcription factor [Candidatus Thermoplasmatota archaeon]